MLKWVCFISVRVEAVTAAGVSCLTFVLGSSTPGYKLQSLRLYVILEG
jgi:hypothetical protein